MNHADYLQNLLGIILNVFDAHTAVLFFRQGDRYVMRANFSLSNHLDEDAAIAPGEGLVGWIIRENQPFFINNFDQKRGFLGYYKENEEANIRAFMGCPVEGGRGALCLDSKRTYSFSQKDQKILHQFCQLIAQLDAITTSIADDGARSRYYDSLQAIHGLRAKSPKWAAFLRAFLEIVSQATGLGFCFLAARGERGETYFIEGFNRPPCDDALGLELPIGGGTVGWVFKEGKPVVADPGRSKAASPLFGRDVRCYPMKTFVCLPLHVHRRTRGVLVAADAEARPIDGELRLFLDMAADHLALFLENLYLKNRLTSLAPK